MPLPLILASGSPQRRTIMGMLGIPFTIKPSQAKEITTITSTVANLVKANALLKATDVAQHYKSGLIIGSDTVVYSFKKRLILKPKDLKEAKKNLKELMQEPHWVYSGVAVIDAATGKRVVDYDKTKVFMTPLSDKSIEAYHRLVNPLDKAGGFDIDGKGGMFIPRIEGCYYNVVGLPLAKLVKMLHQFGVKVL